MSEKIIILDFGSQFTQLIARRVRELNVYCEIHPFNKAPQLDEQIKGIILSGSPCSVRDVDAPNVDLSKYKNKVPILGVCYGAQMMAHQTGNKIIASTVREYGRAKLSNIHGSDRLMKELTPFSQVWMSHGDTIESLSDDFEILASTETVNVAAFKVKGEETYGIQFHPEVTHSLEGKTLLRNFIVHICGCQQDWTSDVFIDSSIADLKRIIGNGKVVLGLSGGVDSSVAAVLIDKAIGDKLTCIFVDNGLLRKDEYEQVLKSYENMGLNVIGVDAKENFYSALHGLSDPELKRKAIGKTFIEIFDQ